MIKSAAVIGAGQMGAGIAQVLASAGIKTLIYDTSPEATARGMSLIEKNLARALEKEKISEQQMQETLENLSSCEQLKDLSSTDLIIEAIIENFDIKKKLFEELDSICQQSTLFATNTSSISITKLAACTQRPDQFVGMHFMNPVPVMKLVEIIRGMQTSEESYQTALKVTEKIGKTAVTAKADYSGFIVNRILVPMINEAFFALMEGLASAEEIDTAMKLGTNQPMGPLELADFVGLDTLLSICNILQTELGEDKYRPCPLLTKYVEAGWYGRKSGRGVYVYSQN
jgi:3-hydroxybutyryl-CoA dehydrogenase